MSNPYFQVARTYLQPFYSSQRSFLTFLFFALLFFVSVSIDRYLIPPFYLVPLIALFVYWAVHVKEQFTDARASLTPGFRKVHGVVATIAAIVFVILLPGAAAPLIGWQFLGFISISTFLFGIILWYILHPGRIFFFFMLGGFVSIQQKPVCNIIEQVTSGNEPVQAFIIVSIGLILSTTGIIRLFLLNEETPEYHLTHKNPIDRQVKLSNLQWKRTEKLYSKGWRNRYANLPVAKLIYHARHAEDSCWSRIHRWNYSLHSVWFILIFAILIHLFLTLIFYFSSMSRLPLAKGPLLSATMIFGTTLLPICVISKLGILKIRFLSHDLMMPVRRDAYFKQVGMSFASSHFILWGVFLAVSVLWTFIDPVKPAPEFLIFLIFYSMIIQIWLFGLAVRIISFRSSSMTILIMAFVSTLSAMPINMMAFQAQRITPLRPIIMMSGGLLAVIGLLLTWWGYRRWLAADFE